MAFGSSPFGTGPYGYPFTPGAAPEPGSIPSSRYIDANGRFVQKTDGTGSYKPQNATIHRAQNLLALNIQRVDKIGADFAATVDSDVRRALTRLVDEEKVLEIIEIVPIDNGTSLTATRIVLKDLIDGQVHEFIR